jgi:hypothetical protein
MITIEDKRYFDTDESQNFSMGYDLEEMKVLPAILLPWPECQKIYDEFYKEHKLIIFPYSNQSINNDSPNSAQAFFYRFTFGLLAYIYLKLLLNYTEQKTFIPITRLHLSDNKNPSEIEEFMRSFSKVLCHLLSEEHLSNSQGIRIKDIEADLTAYRKTQASQSTQSKKPFKLKSGAFYRTRNALSSLYSSVPKIFKFSQASDIPKLKNLAIIVVSSRESDIKKNGAETKISNLMGEVIGVERLQDGNIRLQTLNTFSANYDQNELYATPRVIFDQVDNLYQQGYQHFLYIAKAPYSSSLHMTQTAEDNELFFMSKSIIRYLSSDRRDMKIYPVFYDKYFVVKLINSLSQSLYIQDTMELTNIVDSQQVVVFFNLFNGIKVRDDGFYNGVISYATLLNIYTGVLDDQEIRMGLIYDKDNNGSPNSLKNDILQYLTLFHFSRYEKDKGISLKLDPYENIIGDNSVGKLSVFKHINSEVNFNFLAFLTEVRGALNVEYDENINVQQKENK